MDDQKNLGASDFDDVDAFGLDEFGAPAGLNPFWGAVVGPGAAAVAAVGLRQFTSSPTMLRHSEAIGALVGGLASGVMVAMKGTRAAGWTGLAALAAGALPRLLETYVLSPAAPGVSGVVIEPTQALMGYGGGMGMVEIERTQALMGNDMPQLVGANLRSASDHVQLVGGPALNSHAAHFGSTHFNQG